MSNIRGTMGSMAKKIDSALGFRGLRPWTRHSLVLLVAGLVYVGIGLAFVLAGPNEGRESAMRFQLHYAPLWFWGLVFAAAGVASLISSRYPPASETWGYTSMTGLSVGWAGCYLVGMIPGDVAHWFGVSSAGFGAPIQNWTSVLVWALVAFLWWAISGLVAPLSQKQIVTVITVDPSHDHIESQSYEVDARAKTFKELDQ